MECAKGFSSSDDELIQITQYVEQLGFTALFKALYKCYITRAH